MSTTTVYVAAAYGERRRAEVWAEHLRSSGFAISSVWHAPRANPTNRDELDMSDEERCVILRANLADLARAGVALVLGFAGTPRATWGEAAFAIACGKPVVFVHRGSAGRVIWDSHPKAARVEIAAGWEMPRLGVLTRTIEKAVGL